MKQKQFIIAIFLTLSFSLFAQDGEIEPAERQESKNTEYRQVNGLENWTYDYDISDLEDGKYNLIIRSRDNAGNMSIDGPINIFVDSESDKPTVSISNPSPYMRIGGNLNIVGTAADDDGIESVEVKIDDSNYIKAQGTQFWSSLLNISSIPDGRHTVTARVTDINGLEGEETSVIVNIDKTKPLITIDSHSNGEILSGKKNISGFVSDANGVGRLEFSLDGETYRELKLSGKPEHTERKFSLSVDTRDGEGGTSYIRFRTVDGTGSEGSTVFVYYSDNERPEITIISPLEEEVLNGFVTVTGTVTDEVGIETFTYSYGDEEDVEIPLIAGNPFWSATFDVRGEKNAQIIFKAVDLSGNSEDYKLKVGLAPDEDKPVVNLLDFIDGEELPSDRIIKGIASDDDGILNINYIVDGGEKQIIDAEGPFVLDFTDMEPGKHVIEIYAEDINDISGESEKYTFIIGADSPQIFLTEYTSDKIVEPFFDGIIFQQGKTAKISGSVVDGEGDSTVSFSIDDQEGKPVKVSKGVFSITIPNKLEVGGHDIQLTAADSLGRESRYYSRIYFAAAPGKDEVYNPVQDDRAALFLLDSRLQDSGIVNITGETPLTGYVTGDTIRTVELEPGQSNFTVAKEGSRFTVSAISDSEESAFVVKVTTTSGKEYISEEIKAASDYSKPALILENIQVPVEIIESTVTSVVTVDENGEETSSDETVLTTSSENLESSIIQDSFILIGQFSDANQIVSAKISFSGSADSYGGSIDLDSENNEGIYSFNQKIDLLSLTEGEHFVTVTVTDSLNNSISETLPFIIDRTVPEFSIISPAPDVAVEGIITISGKIDNIIGGGQVSFTENGIDYTEIKMSSQRDFSHNVDLSQDGVDPEKFLYRIVDRARNTIEHKPRFTVDLEADRPKVAIEIPADESTIRNDFSVTGLVFDDDAVDKIFYSLDGTDFKEIEGNFYYNIPFSLSNIDDGHHTITVKAQDSGGFMSEEVSSDFFISKAEPVSELLSPMIDEYTKKTILLEGETYDENGIEQIFISYDNGISYHRAIVKAVVEDIPEPMIDIEEEPEVEDSDEVVTEDSEELISEDPAVESEMITAEEIQTLVQWEYTFDTRLPGDGTHSILIKAIDGAGTIGISSTIINIDNTNPEIKLDSPAESDLAAGNLIIDGKVFDGTRVKSVVSELKALGNSEFPGLIREIETEGVFRDIIDVSNYEPGWYNLNITVTDFAENRMSETRNLQITSPEAGEIIDLYFPEEGKDISGPFAIEGRLFSSKGIDKVVLKIDENIVDTIDVDDTGLFSFALATGDLSDGKHEITVVTNDNETPINSGVRNISYTSSGPWIKVDSMRSGQFVSGRPMITGSAGFSGSEEDKEKAVEKIEVSLDNGRNFSKAKGKEQWEFRLETYDLTEGENQLLLRALFKDGSSSVTKLYVNVDETAPQIHLFTPEENRKFNGSVALVGTAGDENGLSSVEVLIREGSKERYEVPSFIQGLYIDLHGLGATYGELGVGLSFFDDVVKLQAQVGLAPPGRFTGLVFGAKLLATVVDIPFSYFFGYDWEFFSMSVAVGANFNYYSMSPDGYYFTDEGVVLGSVLLQYEFAKFELKNMKMFNSYSLYVEGALWFISSDIQAGVTPTLSFGARIGIF